MPDQLQPLDPTVATSSAFGRRAFVSVSAATVASLHATPVRAQTTGAFGKPHAPIVAEDDPAIQTQRVILARPDVELGAYAAWPVALTAATPGIVMVQHIWGVDSTLRDDVRRYAKAGYICIAPELFARSRPPSGDGTSEIDLFRPAAKALGVPVALGDLGAARNWIATKAPQAKLGITGFCMGGGIALQALIGTTDYRAASIFYGDVRPGTPRDMPTSTDTFAYAARITTPMRGNYGERDTSIAAADVRALFAQLSAPHEVSIYPEAGHAFFDDTRASYVASAATDAWRKTLAWFHAYLG